MQDEVASALSSTLKAIQLSERGVYVQASTLGSLEALLEFLKTSKIPVSTFDKNSYLRFSSCRYVSVDGVKYVVLSFCVIKKYHPLFEKKIIQNYRSEFLMFSVTKTLGIFFLCVFFSFRCRYIKMIV